MVRPLLRYSIVELTQLFESANGDVVILQSLENELKHRNVQRAVALLDKVQRVLRGTRPTFNTPVTAEPAVTGSRQQGTLWSKESKPKQKNIAKTAQAMKSSSVPTSVELPEKSPTHHVLASNLKEVAPSLSADEAYKILKSTPASTWDAIEQTRRLLVQQAHPEKVAELSAERREQVRAEAMLANTAYAILLELRTCNNQR